MLSYPCTAPDMGAVLCRLCIFYDCFV